jgi:hypothetical protein
MKLLMIAAATAAAISFASPAGATDFTTKLTTLEGGDLQDREGKPDPTTLAKVAENALLTSYADEAQNPQRETESIHRYEMARKIHEHPTDPHLSLDELATVKKLILKAYGPLIGGQSAMLIDPSLTSGK